MDLTAQTRVHFPRELVFRTFRDQLPETVPFLPAISSIQVQKRQADVLRTSLTNLWTAKTEIPTLVKKLVKADVLAWVDHADWDHAGWKCQWRIETQALPGLVECTGTTAFFEAGPDTDIRIDGQLVLHLEKANVPRLLAGTVQPLIEKLVISGLKPNLLSTGSGIEKLLLSRQPKS